MNSEEAELFVRLEEAHPEIRIGICLQNRLNESVEPLKEIIESGEYGQVVGNEGIVPGTVRLSITARSPGEEDGIRRGGGCMINQSVHTLDLLYYLGGDIKGLNASVSQILDYGIEVEDTVTARLDYVSGAKGLFLPPMPIIRMKRFRSPSSWNAASSGLKKIFCIRSCRRAGERSWLRTGNFREPTSITAPAMEN